MTVGLELAGVTVGLGAAREELEPLAELEAGRLDVVAVGAAVTASTRRLAVVGTAVVLEVPVE